MTKASLAPVFLISLPRSGSTLLQKLLATSPDIATVSEPWIGLPLAYMRRKSGTAAEYWSKTCFFAIDDLVTQFPRGEADFDELCRDFMLGTYSRLAGDGSRTVFLDKTPRYYLIVSFLARVFPDAKFIFLFRHPLDVFASILNTWHGGGFSSRLKGNAVDIWLGPSALAKGLAETEGRSVRVDYEDLVVNPQKVLSGLAEFIGVRLPETAVDDARNVSFAGRMGDPTKGAKYQGVGDGSVGGWKDFVRNRVRKKVLRNYVASWPDEVNRAFRIESKGLLREIDALPVGRTRLIRDLVGYNRFRLALWAGTRLSSQEFMSLGPHESYRLPIG